MPSLLEALERKYFSDCDLDNFDVQEAESNESITVASTSPSAGDGFQRQISIFIPRVSPLLCVPELLVLNDCDIDCAGDFERIKDKCQRVRELDLAQNKLHDWKEVFHILEHMPRVEFLNLSKNHLMGPISKLYVPAFSNLRGIVLNGTYLDWMCLDKLLTNLPILEELHLSLNNYKEVLIDTAEHASDSCNTNANSNADTHDNCTCCCCCCGGDVVEPDVDIATDKVQHASKHRKCAVGRCKRTDAHKALKSLHFTGNPIESWQEICRLGRVFPSLENLVLADCPIKSIHSNEGSCEAAVEDESAKTEDTNSPHKHFPNLLVLNLSCANINTWEDIDRLANFPKLKNLRIKNLPLWDRLECTEHERRQLLIARLPNVALLNGGGVISADEREDAERAFIRYYMEKPECERPARYAELIAKHGKLDPLVNVNLKPDKRVKVSLIYGERTEPRLVDIYRTVADLKARLEKIVGLPANKMRLYYLDQDYKEWGPEEMKFPNKMLYSYNIQNGDEIIVDEKK